MKDLTEFKNSLASKLQKSPDAEAELILFAVYKKRLPYLKKYSDLIHNIAQVHEDVVLEAHEILDLRLKGVPLQHLLGFQYFYNHEFMVNESVLIPRPETEVLVHSALAWVSELKKKQNTTSPTLTFAELGLGSGIISAELLSAIPYAKGLASEISIDAISVAINNLDSIIGSTWGDRFQIIEPESQSVGFKTFLAKGRFDLIISNPPYLCETDSIEKEVLYNEPKLALFPPEQPNYFYSDFVHHANSLLKSGGAAFFEVPHERAQDIKNLFLESQKFSLVELIQDLTQRPRVIKAILL